jgi:IS4 transposase
MRYCIRNFTKLKQVISTEMLSKIATKYMADYYTKKFFFENHLNFLLIFQITCKESLPEAVQFIKDNKSVKEYAPKISVSQVSRDNNNQDYAMFAEIFYYLVDKAIQNKRIKLSDEEKEYIKNIKILDSTLIRLCLKYFDWAEYRKNVGAIKIHTLYDLESLCPEKIFMTTGKPHDSNLMKTIGFLPHNTYLMDRAYCKYTVFDAMCEEEIYFVTRMKTNATIEVLKENELPEGDHNVLSDSVIIVGNEANGKKMKYPLRLVIVYNEKENCPVFILTNRFDLSALEVANLYTYRWEIEEFFKWIKQHLKVKKFFGQSENAVLIQILTALIVYVLLLLVQEELNYQGTFLELTRIFKNNALEEFDENVFRR